MDTILLWRVVLSIKKVARVSARYITRLEIWVNIQNYLSPSIVSVENNLTIAYLRYYKFKKYFLNQIESWLRDLTYLKAKENWGNQDVIYKSLMTREKQREAVRRLH